MASGFRLRVVGTRALKGAMGVDKDGNPVKIGGQTLAWGSKLAKASDKIRISELDPAADILRKALAKAAPVYDSPYMAIEQKDGYKHKGLSKLSTWKTALGDQGTTTGYAKEIYNTVTVGAKKWSLLDLILYGVKEARFEMAGPDKQLIYPERGGHRDATGKITERVTDLAYLLERKTSRPGPYKANRFDLKAKERAMPEIKARLNKSAARAIVDLLDE